MAPKRKLIVIVGITGNQGGSVASRFLSDPRYHIRGLTRNPCSPSARALASKGVEIIPADLDDVATLIPAFRGANLIFSVTNYWEPFFRPDCRAKAAELGMSCRKYAYEVEVRQGRNIADAVATTVESLDENGFIASTLSHAARCSRGRFNELYHFDAKAEVFPDHVGENHKLLARKTSYVQTGFFMSSYRLALGAYFRKTDEDSFLMSFPCSRHAPIPHLDVSTDLGPFIYAVSQLPPGKHYLAAGTTCSWSEYMRIWSETTGNQTSYKETGLQELIENTPDKEFGREIGDMYLYSSNPGYDGGDKTLLKAQDIKKLGAECPMTGLEEWMRKEDWSMVLNQ
ncbi:hypothetical protein W97_00272 [Coniosporium apollinis CBS 100218]|uniref:NmrA-like domain-containing protein n=1 Tax=Coniosporium apollinis (strain CBS 100218) TaxID=1168221 RepID=R7YHF4_CONA1|nr:uncharacterized protein W97_00272 [Coniosporium apollinis CBS 100218]EON61061.1 hypothetical protein W97_00272 [Coniosporium apollinis CBS 100218]